MYIGTAAARNIVPFTGKLGGKGPLLVLRTRTSRPPREEQPGEYDDAGQVSRRHAPHRRVAGGGRVPELFHRYTDEHVLGDPRDDATTVHADPWIPRPRGGVRRARARSDEIVRGGRRREDVGPLFYDPTLVVPRSNASEIVQRGCSGPC